MPTYEYKCLKCDRTFEVFQNMTDDPLQECEVCKGKLKRLIGAGAGIIFKGSGFYCTDYRSSSYTQAAKKESSQKTTTPDAGKSTTPDAGKSTSKKSTPESGSKSTPSKSAE